MWVKQCATQYFYLCSFQCDCALCLLQKQPPHRLSKKQPHAPNAASARQASPIAVVSVEHGSGNAHLNSTQNLITIGMKATERATANVSRSVCKILGFGASNVLSLYASCMNLLLVHTWRRNRNKCHNEGRVSVHYYDINMWHMWRDRGRGIQLLRSWWNMVWEMHGRIPPKFRSHMDWRLKGVQK